MNLAVDQKQVECAKFHDGIVEEYVNLVDLIIRNEGSINYVKAVKIDKLYIKSAELVRSLLEGTALTEQLRELQRSYQYWSLQQRMQSSRRRLVH